MQVPDGLSRKPHPEGEQPSLKVKDLEQENTHMVIRVTTKDGTRHNVLLNLNSKKAGHEEEIPKVFDYMSDLDYENPNQARQSAPSPSPLQGATQG
jgi:hypothetical protein